MSDKESVQQIAELVVSEVDSEAREIILGDAELISQANDAPKSVLARFTNYATTVAIWLDRAKKAGGRASWLLDRVRSLLEWWGLPTQPTTSRALPPRPSARLPPGPLRRGDRGRVFRASAERKPQRADKTPSRGTPMDPMQTLSPQKLPQIGELRGEGDTDHGTPPVPTTPASSLAPDTDKR